MTTLKSLQSIAKRYRREEPSTPSGGVILIYQGKVYGWKRLLGTPFSEKPGAFAVDESGNIWLAEGGDDYRGAKSWIPFSPLPGQDGQGVSLAAPAEADQVEGTPTPCPTPFSAFRSYLNLKRDSFEDLPCMTGKVLTIDCALHELDLFELDRFGYSG